AQGPVRPVAEELGVVAGQEGTGLQALGIAGEVGLRTPQPGGGAHEAFGFPPAQPLAREELEQRPEATAGRLRYRAVVARRAQVRARQEDAVDPALMFAPLGGVPGRQPTAEVLEDQLEPFPAPEEQGQNL